MRVLLIDDDPVFRELLRIDFNDCDPDVIFLDADDGDTGLQLFKQTSYDAIVVDMNMPRVSGLAFAITIRESDAVVPIILISNLTVGLRSFEPKIMASGVDLVLDKNEPNFVTTLAKALHSFRLCETRK